MNEPSRRRYSMARRSAQVEATKERIRSAAIQLFAEKSYDFTLKEVAKAAQTTVQTVLRLFHSKEALANLALETGEPIFAYPEAPPGNVASAIKQLYDAYEATGDRLLRQIGAERLHPNLVPRIEAARAAHRTWLEKIFAPQLGTRSGPAHQSLLYGLLIATDPQVWKLLRRDQGLYRGVAEAMIRHIVNALLRAY